MNIRNLAVIVVACMLGACGTQKIFYQPLKTFFSRPDIGTVVSANLGEALLSRGEMLEYDSIFISEPLRLDPITLPVGYYPKDFENSHYESFRQSDTVSASASPSGDRLKQIVVARKPNGADFIFVETEKTLAIVPPGAKIERKKMLVAGTGSFQQTLIYSGRVGNKLNIVYRESSDGYARPAFDNRVEYDLSESSVIGYKGAQLEVVEATNQFIKYKVLADFSPVSMK